MSVATLEPIIRAEDLFSGLNPEEEQEAERKIKVVRDSDLEALLNGYEKLSKAEELPDELERLYKICLSTIKNLNYNSKTVRDLSIIGLGLPNSWIFGLYISALINNSSETNFTLQTPHPDSCRGIGAYNNGKQIIIMGPIGDYLGYRMNNGLISVKKNAGNCVGYNIENGKIVIRGNVGEDLGIEMHGGRIEVYGDAEEKVGWDMFGGEIHLFGNHKGLGQGKTGGKIFHKEKLIYDGGSRKWIL